MKRNLAPRITDHRYVHLSCLNTYEYENKTKYLQFVLYFFVLFKFVKAFAASLNIYVVKTLVPVTMSLSVSLDVRL